MEAVRAADRDRYLSALYAPDDKREALLALYAFNAEIARHPRPHPRAAAGRDKAAMVARRDRRPAAPADGHPLAEALLDDDPHATHCRWLTFENYLDARIFDLYDDPMPSRTDLEGYCGETAVGADPACGDDPRSASPRPSLPKLAGHAGCAQAITGLLRLLPIHRARGQCFVPARHSCRRRHVAGGIFAGRWRSRRDTRGRGDGRRWPGSIFRPSKAGCDLAAKRLRPAFLPLALTGAYLDRIETNPAAVFAPDRSTCPHWRRHWLLLRRASRGLAASSPLT